MVSGIATYSMVFSDLYGALVECIVSVCEISINE